MNVCRNVDARLLCHSASWELCGFRDPVSSLISSEFINNAAAAVCQKPQRINVASYHSGPPSSQSGSRRGGAWDGINEEEAQCDEDDEDATPRTRTGLTEYTHTHTLYRR